MWWFMWSQKIKGELKELKKLSLALLAGKLKDNTFGRTDKGKLIPITIVL